MSKRHHRYKVACKEPPKSDIVDTFDKVAAAMFDAGHQPRNSKEGQALVRMVKLAEHIYNEHFALAETKYSFSLFIACMLEIQMENFNAKESDTVPIH